MLKTRIYLLLAGILISAFLFMLPKVVVDNDKEKEGVAMEQTQSTAKHEHAEEAHGHEQEIDSVTQLSINNLTEFFTSSENKEKSATFADSLAILFQSVGALDSAAKYRGWLADNFPNEENVEFAGLAYYEAFGYAIQDEKVKMYGKKVQHYLGQILESHEDRLDLKSKIAMTHISSQNPMQGIMMLREVIEEDPSNIEALFNLGLLSRQSGQMDKAVERFESILELDENHIQARFLLALTYLEKGKTEEAKQQFEIVKESSDDPTIIETVDSYLENIN